MSRRWLVRIAAPTAFLAGVTIAVLIVRDGIRGDADAAPTTTAVVETAPATTRGKPKPPAKRRPVYARVEPGDTLDQIALEHDTTVRRLLELNPGIDPASLTIGQRVRVR